MMLSLPSLAADVVTVSAAPAPPAVAEPASSHWYGWQTLLADAGSVVLIPAAGAGLIAYPLAAPIIHAAHGRWAIAGLDAGLRITLPLLSGWLAFQAAYQPCTGDCSNVWFPKGTVEGLAAGAIAAGVVSIVDATVLSWERRAPEPVPAAKPQSGPQWTPTAMALRGGALAGINGRF
jgi:hypothetical protein